MFKIREILAEKRTKLTLAVASGLGTVGVAFAGTFSNVVTVLTDVVEIFPPLTDMIIAIVPMVVTLAILGFIIKLFSTILDMIRAKTRGL